MSKEKNKPIYDVIFGAWLLENLTDVQLIKFLINAQKSLKKDGIMIFTFNHSDERVASPEYEQINRTMEATKWFFNICGLKILDLEENDLGPSIPKNVSRVALGIK